MCELLSCDRMLMYASSPRALACLLTQWVPVKAPVSQWAGGSLRFDVRSMATDGCTCHRQEALSPEWLGIRIGDRHPVLSVGCPPSHAHMPSLASWEAGMERPIGCLDGSVGCLQWQNTHRSGGTHTHTDAHPAWCLLSCQVSASLTASVLATLPKRPGDFIYLFNFEQAQGGQLWSVHDYNSAESWLVFTGHVN